jgi:uncharacterized protein (TIGR00730 family)
MKRICVYCGSSRGNSPDYADAAKSLAETLIEDGLSLVFGGSSKGIMGVVADHMLALGGEVIGVIPQSLQDKEVAHDGLTRLHIVDSMHERKSLMAVLSDGFIAMPGGTGTLEEIIETLTWAQLQFHEKPCGLLNINGYFDQLIAFLDHAVGEGFLRQEHRDILSVDSDPGVLLEKFRRYDAPIIIKWTD